MRSEGVVSWLVSSKTLLVLLVSKGCATLLAEMALEPRIICGARYLESAGKYAKNIKAGGGLYAA